MKRVFTLCVLVGLMGFVAKVMGQTTTTFSYTGAAQTFTVPTGVTSLTVKLWGAGGAGGDYASGGSGSFVTGTLTVTSGQVLTIVVGQGGIIPTSTTSTTTVGYGGGGGGGYVATYTGGGGGGRSSIQLTAGTDAVTAGAGGGGGGYNYGLVNGYSGYYYPRGGGGGATDAYDGYNGASGTYAGKLGTTTAGGAAGATSIGTSPTAGSSLKGGYGGTYTYCGGGGGGGYFGGGGGSGSGSGAYCGGGGGGSSYTGYSGFSGTNTAGVTANSAATTSAGSSDANYVSGVGNGGSYTPNPGGNGEVVITYTASSGTIAVNAGNNQSSTVGTAVSTLPSVIVKNSSGVAVSNVAVTFTVTGGGGSVSPTTVSTNSSGIATIGSWTLGTTAGTNTLTATASGYTGSPVTFTATGTAAAASKLVIKTQPTAPASNGAVLGTQPAVYIEDQYGNITTSTATVTATSSGGTWTIGGTTSVAGSAGTATFTNLTATSAAAIPAATITFTATGLTSVTSSSFVIPAPAPANDNCSGATTIIVNAAAIAGTSVSATQQYAPQCSSTSYAAYDVWYSFTTDGNSDYTINVTTTAFDAILNTFSACGSASYSVACADNYGSSGTETIDAGVLPAGTYYYRVYGYQGATGSFTTNVTSVLPTYNWIGYGSGGSSTQTDFNTGSNWSTGVVPGAGSAAVITFTSSVSPTIALSANATVGSLTISDNTGSGSVRTHTLSVGTYALFINGNLNVTNNSIATTSSLDNISVASGGILNVTGNMALSNGNTSNYNNVIQILNSGTMTVSGTTAANSLNTSTGSYINIDIGNSPAVTTLNGTVTLDDGSTVSGNSVGFDGVVANATGKVIVKGNIVLGPNSGFGPNMYPNANLIFDATSAQSITDNTSTYLHVTGNITIGSSNNPTVTVIKGNTPFSPDDVFDVYTNLTINGTSVFVLPAAEIINNYSGSGTLSVANGATLKLGGTSSVTTAITRYTTNTGSNFPYNYSTYTLNPTSTVEYNGTSAQTIYATPTYGNLTVSNTNITSGATASGALTIANNLFISASSKFSAGTSLTHNVGGNWTNNGTFAYTTANTINFNGNNALQTISGSSTTGFGNIIVNKGTLQSNILEVTSLITMANGGLTLANGTFKLSSASAITPFNIGASISSSTTSSAGLWNNGGTINTTNGTINLYGLFRNSAGTTNFGSNSGNSLTYFNVSGGSQIIIEGGNVNIAGRLEPNSSGSKVTYNQSGGILTLVTQGSASSTAAGFDMSTIGSSFTMTGGTIVVQQPTSFTSDYVNLAGTYSNTGGTLQIGNSSTTGSPSKTIRINSPNALNNLTVNTTGSPIAQIVTNDLTVKNLLNLNAGTILDINGRILTLNGTVNNTGSLRGSVASNLTLGTNGNTGTLYFDQTTNNTTNLLKIFTLNTNASATLGNLVNITPGNSGSYGAVTVTGGQLIANGNLTLQSNASGTAQVGYSTGTILGDVTVERYFPGTIRAWRFVAIPFASTTQTINAAWQDGHVYCNSYPPCSMTYDDVAGHGTEITYNNVCGSGYDYHDNTYKTSIQTYQNNTWQLPISGTYSNLVTEPNSLHSSYIGYPAYALFVRGDRHICLSGINGYNSTTLAPKGVLNQTGGDVAHALPLGNAGEYILIGNPYAATISLNNILSSQINSAIINPNVFYTYDPTNGGTMIGTGGYQTHGSGNITVPYDGSTSGSYIQSGQAFMLKLRGSGTPQITFKEADKVAGHPQTISGVFGLTAASAEAPPSIVYTNLIDTTGAIMDGVAGAFGNQYSANVDDVDATKKWNEEIENMAIIRHDTALAIEFRPMPKSSDTLFFRLYLRQHPYSLKVFSQDLAPNFSSKAWIVDKYLGTETEVNLRDTSIYNFTPNSDTNSYRNRFELVFSPVIGGRFAKLDSLISKVKAHVFPNPVSGRVFNLVLENGNKDKYTVNIFTTKGMMVSSTTIDCQSGKINYLIPLAGNLTSGSYTVQILNSSGIIVNAIPLIIAR